MKIFVIIVTYNGEKWIEKCVSSVLNSTIKTEIIIIDNVSSDGTKEIIKKNYPETKLIETKENLGFGKANNIGIRMAYEEGADYIFLLNQDAWVEEDTLEKLSNIAKRNGDYGILSPVHLNASGNAFDYGFINYLCRNKDKYFISDLYLKNINELNEIYQLDFINAAFWLISKKTVETVGGFNPFFFQYGEDRDYINRCQYFELKIGFIPLAKGYHDRIQYDSDLKIKKMNRLNYLIKTFDPQNDEEIKYLVKMIIVSFLKNIVLFKFKAILNLLLETKYILGNIKKILYIKRIVKIPGKTFLD